MDKISKKQGIRRTNKEKIVLTIVFVLMVIYAITLLYPFVYLLLNSFKGENIVKNPLGFPKEFTLKNYVKAFTDMKVQVGIEQFGVLRMLLNTLLLTVGQTFVTMSLTCMASYVLAKYKFRGSGFIYTFVIIASVVPTIGAEAAIYKLMYNTLNVANTYVGMLIMCGGFGGSFLYLHSFFKQIPWSYGESAMIDGASDFKVFLRIYVPLAKNGITVFTIMNALGFWNEYWKASLYYGKRPTLAVGITLLQNLTPNKFSYGVYFAGLIICIIPILIFYCFSANKLVDNLTGGGIKG